MTFPTTTMRRAAVTSAVAVAALGLGMPASAAAKDVRIDGKYGYVTFKAHGEVLEAADLYPDGRGVRAYLHWGRTKSASVTNSGKLYPVPRNLSIPEGTPVSLTMCYTQHGQVVSCAKNKRGVA